MRHSRLWSVAITATVGSAVFLLGGLLSGNELGQMVAGYSLLTMLSAVYLALGLAIRERVWQRLSAPRKVARPLPIDLHGRRVF